MAFPLLQSGAGAFQIGLGLHHRGLRLANLLIQIRSFNFGEQLPRLDLIADVGVAFREVSFGARENGSLGNCLNVARQHQGAASGTALRHRKARLGQGFVVSVGLRHQLQLAGNAAAGRIRARMPPRKPRQPQIKFRK